MPSEPVALVLAGGGARGAYEAGALTVLLPELARRGQRPTIVVGTSVGALNAAFAAANADRPVPELVVDAQRIWSEVTYDQVLAPLLSPGTLERAASYLGEALGIPRARLWSLLDPAPLRRTLPARVDFAALARNVADGTVRAAAVVATSARTNRSVVFSAGTPPPRAHDDRRGIDYVATDLLPEHVLASAAIPALFPAVRVTTPAGAAGWYVDGGTRLDTPIKPALELGAARVVVVALGSLAPADLGDARPDALVGAGRALGGLLDEQLVSDARTLGTVNELVRAAGGEVPDPAGGRTKRVIPHILVASAPGRIGALAREIFAERYTGLRGALRQADVAALGRAVAGDADAAHGELLSYLFFAPEFTGALLELGAADAAAWLAADHPVDGIWDL